MEALLTYFIGLQIGLQFYAGFFAFKLARMRIVKMAGLRLPMSLITVAVLILSMRRVQALLSVKIIAENFDKFLGPISLDTIVVQTAVSICLVFGMRHLYKYFEKLEL